MRRHRRPDRPTVPTDQMRRSVIVSTLKQIVMSAAIVIVALLAAFAVGAFASTHSEAGAWLHAALSSGLPRE
jgi:hypothetical protein